MHKNRFPGLTIHKNSVFAHSNVFSKPNKYVILRKITLKEEDIPIIIKKFWELYFILLFYKCEKNW